MKPNIQRPLVDNVVFAITGLWPEGFAHPDDCQYWIDTANSAIAMTDMWRDDPEWYK
jgi:hypothetical protein